MTIREELFTESEKNANANLGWLGMERDRLIRERKKDAESRRFDEAISEKTPQDPHWLDYLNGRNK